MLFEEEEEEEDWEDEDDEELQATGSKSINGAHRIQRSLAFETRTGSSARKYFEEFLKAYFLWFMDC